MGIAHHCRLAALVITGIIAGLGGTPLRADNDTALNCARAAERSLAINLSSGVYTEAAVVSAPLAITIPAGSDADRYQDCLRREGNTSDRRANMYAERLQRCRGSTAAAQAQVDGSNGAVRLSAGRRPEAMNSCLDGSVEVEASFPND